MLKFKDTAFSGKAELLKLYRDGEFDSPYRSTIPLLYLALDQPELLDPHWESKDCILEMEVKPKRGQGRPSCSDLAIMTELECTVMEAKRTEPPYETVRDWFDGSENKSTVLDGWLEYIGDNVGAALRFTDVEDLPYQLIHRVASACFFNRQQTTVNYIVFEPNEEKRSYYLGILQKMKQLTGGRISYQCGFYAIQKSATQNRLEQQWDQGMRNMREEIMRLIAQERLMSLELLEKVQI